MRGLSWAGGTALEVGVGGESRSSGVVVILLAPDYRPDATNPSAPRVPTASSTPKRLGERSWRWTSGGRSLVSVGNDCTIVIGAEGLSGEVGTAADPTTLITAVATGLRMRADADRSTWLEP